MYKCIKHPLIELVAKSDPFFHFACPVAGCTFVKANKWARKNAKTRLANPFATCLKNARKENKQ